MGIVNNESLKKYIDSVNNETEVKYTVDGEDYTIKVKRFIDFGEQAQMADEIYNMVVVSTVDDDGNVTGKEYKPYQRDAAIKYCIMRHFTDAFDKDEEPDGNEINADIAYSFLTKCDIAGKIIDSIGTQLSPIISAADCMIENYLRTEADVERARLKEQVEELSRNIWKIENTIEAFTGYVNQFKDVDMAEFMAVFKNIASLDTKGIASEFVKMNQPKSRKKKTNENTGATKIVDVTGIKE